MLDLAKKDPAKVAEVGYEFTVVLPDGSETDAKVTVRGAQSATVKNHARKVYQEMKVRSDQAERRGKKAEELTLEDLEQMNAENAAMRIICWTNVAENGEEVPFTKENAVRVMKTYPFLSEQVLEASNNVFNFPFRD